MDYTRNTAEIGLGTNIWFVTIDLHSKYKFALGIYIRYVCIYRDISETALGTNIWFVTSAVLAKYDRNLIGNGHRVCNH